LELLSTMMNPYWPAPFGKSSDYAHGMGGAQVFLFPSLAWQRGRATVGRPPSEPTRQGETRQTNPTPEIWPFPELPDED
jgi:hypothetical protein